jgi:hypothetical protein
MPRLKNGVNKTVNNCQLWCIIKTVVKERDKMKSVLDYRSNWSGGTTTPELNQNQWNMLAIPAAILAVMAILQLISFGKFKDWLDGVGIGWSAVVAVVIIIAELWGAASLLRVPMSAMVRFFGLFLSVAATSFWFVENLYLVSRNSASVAQSSGYFGRYLTQTPGWWSVIEISILLFWIIYAAELLKWRPGTR